VSHFSHEGGLVESDDLLETSHQILLSFLVIVGEAQEKAPLLLALAQDVLVEEQLDQDQGNLGADFQTVGHHFQILVLVVQRVGVAALLDILVEQVDAFFLAQFTLFVEGEVLQGFGQLLFGHDGRLVYNAVPVAVLLVVFISVLNELNKHRSYSILLLRNIKSHNL